MSELMINRGVRSHRNSLSKLQFGPFLLISSLIVFVCLITVITLMFSTRQVTKGYVLSKLDAQNQTLVKEGEQRQMQISEVRSLDYLQSSPQIANMVRPNTVVFLGSDTAIASR